MFQDWDPQGEQYKEVEFERMPMVGDYSRLFDKAAEVLPVGGRIKVRTGVGTSVQETFAILKKIMEQHFADIKHSVNAGELIIEGVKK